MEDEVRQLLVEMLEKIAGQQELTLAWLRKYGIVFRDLGTDPLNWQHVAFSLYTEICELSVIAQTALRIVREEAQ